ncbi:hypothetical protein EH240_37085 [Mesorhizobium tamadayense]|uniref:Uncharacterized protein n=1 Tax=Mesorhizobium tamadayense TaxID=425306 RepID=A0A3P3EDZ8_9HYPH|nr:hypothetical protein [Mesorhizobium tamadayense]RRH84629.1 hypothetical protein EH240_37085 [Mesorhizobium tamadayense]
MSHTMLFDIPGPRIALLTWDWLEKLNVVPSDPDVHMHMFIGTDIGALALGTDIAGYMGRPEREFMVFQFARCGLNDRRRRSRNRPSPSTIYRDKYSTAMTAVRSIAPEGI